ncbi:Retrovirus-related Pol polyprotein from transposon TNT 1-94 [Dendrobium catenatum]|uniref:Retrovirus-related Pol polyprotein from transposon TNT 1-94 n=2 Tax=Dendrobium catenatum TaxID=906689 RepID=A0A2I0VMN5_9ASPA|nr:Retrovirus-related Pol polyprotein from transposon TNT 1-94 [Dendrobium catenatum]
MHHPTILKCFLRYIQGTIHFGLPLTTTPLQLRTYSDADWAGDPHDRKSTTGFCTFLGTTPISWCVKKQATVTKTSTKAEYRSLSSATSDVIWIQRLLADFQLPPTTPTPLYCNNTSAMAIAHHPVFHARTKHIEIDYHFIRHHITNGEIVLHHIYSEEQPADLLIKPLPSSRFQDLRDKLSIKLINA